MGYPEEPRYQKFTGTCRVCGKRHDYWNSVQRHPDHDICDDCERAKILETLTGQKSLDGAVKGQG